LLTKFAQIGKLLNIVLTEETNSKLSGLSPQANYIDRATAAFGEDADRWCHVVSVTDSYGRRSTALQGYLMMVSECRNM
jgi:hypothetical protein